MTHLDLFSGIGGFALAADRVFGDVEHIFVEIDPFCQRVLKKHRLETEIGMRSGLKLQPNFVEWMMGYPQDWTSLAATPKQHTAENA